MAFSGLIIVFSTLYPILSYEWYAESKYPDLVSPLIDGETGSFKFSDKDYTKADNWFENVEKTNYIPNTVSFYTITIPKLKIDNVTVGVGGVDLKQNLIQYAGSAYPGNIGNTVIFGHSILPQYFDPKNYLSMFSTLPNLKDNDQIFINYDGVTYTYEVQDIFEVSPRDLEVLNQDKDASYLSLITCSPPGHPLKPRRLVVRAKLV
jgi:LPXTG-site transpeptidase (sortase) family protein